MKLMADEKKTQAAEAKAEDTASEASADTAVEVPAKFTDLVKQIEELSVLDLSELVKVLEDKFGVSAAAPVAVAGAPVAGGGDGEAEEKTAFDVELTDAGGSKIAVIKVVKEATGKGLKEAKDMVDSAPAVIGTGMKKEEADELVKKLSDAGAVAVLK